MVAARTMSTVTAKYRVFAPHRGDVPGAEQAWTAAVDATHAELIAKVYVLRQACKGRKNSTPVKVRRASVRALHAMSRLMAERETARQRTKSRTVHRVGAKPIRRGDELMN